MMRKNHTSIQQKKKNIDENVILIETNEEENSFEKEKRVSEEYMRNLYKATMKMGQYDMVINKKSEMQRFLKNLYGVRYTT